MGRKIDLYARLQRLGMNDKDANALCNFFETPQLQEYVEFLEQERRDGGY